MVNTRSTQKKIEIEKEKYRSELLYWKNMIQSLFKKPIIKHASIRRVACCRNLKARLHYYISGTGQLCSIALPQQDLPVRWSPYSSKGNPQASFLEYFKAKELAFQSSELPSPNQKRKSCVIK